MINSLSELILHYSKEIFDSDRFLWNLSFYYIFQGKRGSVKFLDIYREFLEWIFEQRSTIINNCKFVN